MNDCESCMFYFDDLEFLQYICIAKFNEILGAREGYVSKLWNEHRDESPSDDEYENYKILAVEKYPCKYHTTRDEFITWKQ